MNRLARSRIGLGLFAALLLVRAAMAVNSTIGFVLVAAAMLVLLLWNVVKSLSK